MKKVSSRNSDLQEFLHIKSFIFSSLTYLRMTLSTKILFPLICVNIWTVIWHLLGSRWSKKQGNDVRATKCLLLLNAPKLGSDLWHMPLKCGAFTKNVIKQRIFVQNLLQIKKLSESILNGLQKGISWQQKFHHNPHAYPTRKARLRCLSLLNPKLTLNKV